MDVYAKAGIPMPPNPDEDKVVPEENEKSNPQADVEWQRHIMEGEDRRLREVALKMTLKERVGPTASLIVAADKFYKFLKDGVVPDSTP